MIAEHTISGAVLRRYVHGVGDEPISGFALHDAAFPPPERRRLCHGYEGASLSARKHCQTDNQGSVTAITDGSGNVTHKNKYNEYGVPDLANTGRF